MTARILVVDDDVASGRLFVTALSQAGYQVEWVQTGEAALIHIQKQPPDLLISDLRLPGMSGLDVTRHVRQSYPRLPVVVITAFGSMETVVEALREGAFDYLSKPMHLAELPHTVSRALAQPAQQDRLESGETDRAANEPLGVIIGRSPAMIEVYKLVARVAPTASTVLLIGESGTGKELIARAIHQHSPRAQRPFVAVDCGTLTETLLESELFGHVRGAFTGAVREKTGVFAEAQGGTCFLDEIGHISSNMQAKLLRVLQEHEVRQVGGKAWRKVDIRVIAATNKDLTLAVKNGAFRHDLYYRLNVITLALPPLRERTDDIPVLAHAFLQRLCQATGKMVTAITDEALHLLCTYPWPGNIRELEHVMERAVVLSTKPVLTSEDFPIEIREGKTGDSGDALDLEVSTAFTDQPTLEELTKRYVRYILSHTQGNLTQAARILHIDRRSLYRLLERSKIAPFSKEE